MTASLSSKAASLQRAPCRVGVCIREVFGPRRLIQAWLSQHNMLLHLRSSLPRLRTTPTTRRLRRCGPPFRRQSDVLDRTAPKTDWEWLLADARWMTGQTFEKA